MTAFPEYPSSLSADGVLVRAYLDGDDEAFEILFRRYHPVVVNIVRAKTGGDRALAEDVAQETLLRALRYLHTYDPSRQFWPWLRKIATNIANTECARRGIEVPVDEVDTVHLALPDPTEQIVTHDLVMQCMAELKPRQRRALTMRYVEDRDLSYIAAVMGIKRNAVQQLLMRARASFAAAYRSRNAALTPGFAALAHRMRRAFAALSSKLQGVGGAAFSGAGDIALGAAALTVGGIGIVTTFSGDRGAPDPRFTGARPGVTGGVPYATATDTAVPLSASARALSGALVTGTAGAAGPGVSPGGTTGWTEGGATAAAPGETGTPGDSTAPDAPPAGPDAGPGAPGSGPGTGGDGTGGSAPRISQEETPGTGTKPPVVSHQGNEPEVGIRVDEQQTGGTGTETSVTFNDDEASADVKNDNDVASGSGGAAINRQLSEEGKVVSEGVYVEAGGERVGTSGSVYNTSDNGVLCDPILCL